MKLNGWQRLWVVFAGVTALATAAFGWVAWPHSRPASLQAIDGCLAELAKPLDKWWLKDPIVKALPDPPRSSSPPGEWPGVAVEVVPRDCMPEWDAEGNLFILGEPAPKNQEHRPHLNERRLKIEASILQQRRDLAVGLSTSWVVLVGLVYVAGWAVAWVRRGFARPS